MSKPEFSKPFCLEHAKAGAPYCCRDGHAAHILKWDRNVSDYPLLGVIRKSDDPRTWTETGSVSYAEQRTSQYDCDLVMLPLGIIDGKPAFVGDELVFISSGRTAFVEPDDKTLSHCRWPIPAPEYPETQTCAGRLSTLYDTVLHRSGIDGGRHAALHAIANFALRHAIDAGQVVPSAVHDKATRALIRGGWQDLGGQEWKPKIGEKPAYIRDEERDMAIAEAAAQAVYNKVYMFGSHRVAYCDLRLDLPAIIASVTGAKDTKEGAK